jgi:uncharacterized membrane protein YphA (DoxX/SURF4 family)
MKLRLRPTARELPLRISTGAFILNSGLSKKDLPPEAAKQIHGMATNTYPFLGKMQPEEFAATLSKAEIAIGAMLLAPFVPTAVAGAALLAFSGGLLGLYLRTPGMREPGSLRPTQQGIALAKDVWMVGIGASLLADGLTADD